LVALGFELRAYMLGRSFYHLSHSASPFLWFFFFFFEIGSCELFAQGWLWPMILLISASWIDRITGVSHQHPAHFAFVVGRT
jgi:hypothetical protein